MNSNFISRKVELVSVTFKMPEVGKIQATREIALIAVLSAAYATAISLIIIPSPTGGYTHVGDFVVFMAALLFGIELGVLWA